MVSGGATKRMQIEFSGRVQGVGFRYTICRVAKRLKVSGYVRNLSNGDVEMVAEGAEQELVDFLNGIRGTPTGRYISREQTSWLPATGQYNGFGISF